MPVSGHTIPKPVSCSKRAQIPSIPKSQRCSRNQPVESMSGSSSSPQSILFPCTFQGLLWENGSVQDSPSSAPSVSPRELPGAEMHKMWGPWRGWRWWWRWGWGGGGVTDSRDPAGEKPEPSKCLLMFHGKGADFIGALMGDMSLIGSAGWWMASSQMGMWQGSLEVFCGAVLNKKGSLPRKKKEA